MRSRARGKAPVAPEAGTAAAPVTTPRLAVVLLNFRYPEVTRECLKSLSPSGPDAFTVYLVDNSPGAESDAVLHEALRASGLAHRYLPSPRNLGFGDGMNRGLRAALDEGFTHLAVLNNDTKVDPDFGARLREAAIRFPESVLAGKVLDADTGAPSFNTGKLARWTMEVLHAVEGNFRPDFVSGCFAVFPAKVLRAVGLYREDYFMYAEDTELCVRLRRAGVPIQTCPDIVIRHRSGYSAERSGTPRQYYGIRNHARLVGQHGSPAQKAVYALRMAAVLVNQTRHPRVFRTVWKALWDAARGRMGQRSAPA